MKINSEEELNWKKELIKKSGKNKKSKFKKLLKFFKTVDLISFDTSPSFLIRLALSIVRNVSVQDLFEECIFI